jgi:hypothetical protein
MEYNVTVSVDHLDPNPSEHFFDNADQATDFVNTHVMDSVQWRVDHSSYTVSEEERNQFEEEEFQLVRMERV